MSQAFACLLEITLYVREPELTVGHHPLQAIEEEFHIRQLSQDEPLMVVLVLSLEALVKLQHGDAHPCPGCSHGKPHGARRFAFAVARVNVKKSHIAPAESAASKSV